VRTVARRAGLDVGRVDATPTTHEHVAQVNATDWDFLTARARETGYEVAVVAGRLSGGGRLPPTVPPALPTPSTRGWTACSSVSAATCCSCDRASPRRRRSPTWRCGGGTPSARQRSSAGRRPRATGRRPGSARRSSPAPSARAVRRGRPPAGLAARGGRRRRGACPDDGERPRGGRGRAHWATRGSSPAQRSPSASPAGRTTGGTPDLRPARVRRAGLPDGVRGQRAPGALVARLSSAARRTRRTARADRPCTASSSRSSPMRTTPTRWAG
jgi:hypothetical protein